MADETIQDQDIADDTVENGSDESLQTESSNDENTTNSPDDKEDISIFDLSDEEFAKLDFSKIGEVSSEDSSESNSTEEESTSTEESELDSGDTKDTEVNNEDEDTKSGADTDNTPPSSDQEETENKESASKEVDYKQEYTSALSPLKANGKMHDINNINDLRALASMGMNYHEKMAQIKPYRVRSKKLENNKITDDKLDFLIDVNNGNPDAIKQLLKEHKVDPLDINLEENTEYSPTKHEVSESELQLDSVLEDINNTDTYNQTLEIVSKRWDDASQSAILAEPVIIKHLNDQVASGIYDQISRKVDYKRMIGELSGVSDLEAYKIVGDEIQANGGFSVNKNNTPKTANGIKTFTEKANNTPTPKKVDKAKLNSRKKAASPTKSMPTNPNALDLPNPFELSDEDFKKYYSKIIK